MNRMHVTGATSAVAAVLLCAAAAPAGGVVVETVTVGNAGNSGEMSGSSVIMFGNGTGVGLPRRCGAVNYVYEIGKYEITEQQYVDFLNAVAAYDTYGLY